MLPCLRGAHRGARWLGCPCHQALPLRWAPGEQGGGAGGHGRAGPGPVLGRQLLPVPLCARLGWGALRGTPTSSPVPGSPAAIPEMFTRVSFRSSPCLSVRVCLYPSPQAGPSAREKRLPEPSVVRRLRAVTSLGFLMAELLINAIAAALFLHRRVESRHVSLSAPSLCYKCLMSCLLFSFACLSFLSCMSCSAFNLLNFRRINFSP